MINRAIQNGRFRGVPGVPDGIAGKWRVPYCVENGGFLVPGHGACPAPLPPLPGRCRHHLLTTVRTPSRLQPCLLSTRSGLRCFTSTLHGTLQPSVPPYSSAAASPLRRRATQPCTASTRRWCFGSANSVSLPIQSPHRHPLTRNSEGNGISLSCARGVVESARGPLGAWGADYGL